ncbi:Na+/H+ antiporter NhaA [Panacibacter ginsenosidivorans]|uniref:Na(+)/H(+) antiporter NhaA n=1 Tax=Panacibacter ginsenosidivorans TaxID=1813871 RepID=A0A5B8V4D9_9BACT|nr:Na+/H+ antiporter NhaA [Panacibacter ginsenosidivorans]QEC66049.1 Na+/H+ antiporter NhaA [Panacibacter ginsenosidivorans]
MALTKLFNDFFNSEKAGGLVLVACTILSLALANSAWQHDYIGLWHTDILGLSLEHWINDGLMAIFFLLIGLELERELYVGELSNLKNALLPVLGALGGMIIPACIFLFFNFRTPTQSGAGIPMATDIAFSLGILALLGSKVPASLKIFLTALAVIDDLGAIIIIAVFYTGTLSVINLLIALFVFGILLLLNRLKIHNLIPYIIGGIVMWYFMLQSGVHTTIAGVLLAFAVPFGDGSIRSPSYKLQHVLHKPVAFIIMPLFALANTGIIIHVNWYEGFADNNSIGILSGLVAGKPTGIILFCFLAVITGVCSLPPDVKWKHLFGAGLLAGIGFTMSIFITQLAYTNETTINSSKFMVLIASLISGILGFSWLKSVFKRD